MAFPCMSYLCQLFTIAISVVTSKERLEIEKGGKVDATEAVEIFPIKTWER